ncbi:unnamed protein product [Paramecium octaurelia]|uniref:Histidine kinase/HSP90-like ATPase domain-containing protein n=1 Tax=Paramecium octaurelia TaxID=43137 RepID=A0A8S1XCL4_PAROT|nr:unnamed protein product [Paramecium octaurelia]
MHRKNLWKKELKYSLNYFISLFFLGLEIELQADLNVIQILSIIIIVISIAFRVLYSFQQISWKIDISPIFLWLLTLARINSASNLNQEWNSFLFYTLGFVNGQYNSTLSIQNENPIIYKGKIFVQVVILVTCLSITSDIKLGIMFILIILCILVGFNEIFYKQMLNEIEIQVKENKQNRLFNELSFQQIQKSSARPLNDEQLFIKHSRACPLDSIAEDEEIPESKQKQQNASNSTKSSLWGNFVFQCDDYIIKFSFNAYQNNSLLQNSVSNYSFSKFLQDNNITFVDFLSEMKVFNDIYWTQFDIQSPEFKKQQSLYDWLQYHLEQYKIIEQLQSKKSLKQLDAPDPLQLSNLSNQKSLLMDLIMEKSIMGLSSIPHQQSSSEAMNLKNSKMNLFGRIKTNKSMYDLQIKFYIFEEDSDGLAIVFLMRDIDKLVQSIKQNVKNLELLDVSTKFIQNQACKITEIHKWIREIKSPSSLLETDYLSRMGTSARRRTYSLCSNRNSEEGQSDISEKVQLRRQSQLQLFLSKLQFEFFQVEQDNFNFYEVFSQTEKILFDKKKIDICQSVHLIFDQFHHNQTLMKYGVKLMLIDNNLHDKTIITDARRFKQLLINIINNSIQAYQFEQYLQQPNEVEITVWNYYEEIHFTITDYGCGLTHFQLNQIRLQECKLGLAAAQRLLYQLSGGKKQIMIQCVNQRTTVSFQLPRILMDDKILQNTEFDYEYIKFINS